MNVIRYLKSYFHVDEWGASAAKYEAGKHYPVTDETSLHVQHGIAEVIEAPADAEKAASAAEAAEAKAARAAEQAQAARQAAEAALVAATVVPAEKVKA